MLRQLLRLREAEGFSALFVDASTLADDWELTLDEIRDVFPSGKKLTFHVIGPVGGLRWEPDHDPRFVFHTGAAAAWQAWENGPSTRGVTTAGVCGGHSPASGCRRWAREAARPPGEGAPADGRRGQGAPSSDVARRSSDADPSASVSGPAVWGPSSGSVERAASARIMALSAARGSMGMAVHLAV
jgi:hypothetical protein